MSSSLARHSIASYARLLAWRGLLGTPTEGPPLSSVLLHQDQSMLTRLRGDRCSSCGLVAYPSAKLCKRCRSADLHPQRLARQGKVFTFTRDRLFEGIEPEIAMLVVDLADGARVFVQGTDADAQSFEIGTDVELVLRKIDVRSEYPAYYWKARPILSDVKREEARP